MVQIVPPLHEDDSTRPRSSNPTLVRQLGRGELDERLQDGKTATITPHQRPSLISDTYSPSASSKRHSTPHAIPTQPLAPRLTQLRNHKPTPRFSTPCLKSCRRRGSQEASSFRKRPRPSQVAPIPKSPTCHRFTTHTPGTRLPTPSAPWQTLPTR